MADLSQFFFETDARIVALLLVFSIVLIAEASFRVGGWLHRERGIEADSSFSVVEGGVLGLIALILGFSFSLAGTRFDARQVAVVTEANAIGTTYLRASFLDPRDREPFRSLLTQYTAVRLNRYQNYWSDAIRDQSSKETAELQTSMWRFVADTANRRPSPTTSSLVQTTNETFDSGSALDASLANHVPGAIVLLVIVASLVGAAVVGFGFGLGNSSHVMVSGLYAIIITLLVTTTLDLDRPSRGLIQMHVAPLSDQLQTMKGRP